MAQEGWVLTRSVGNKGTLDSVWLSRAEVLLQFLRLPTSARLRHVQEISGRALPGSLRCGPGTLRRRRPVGQRDRFTHTAVAFPSASGSTYPPRRQSRIVRVRGGTRPGLNEERRHGPLQDPTLFPGNPSSYRIALRFRPSLVRTGLT